MHTVSITNFILLASTGSCALFDPPTLASHVKARNYRNYAFRLAFHANAASLEYSLADWREPVAKRTPHAVS